MISCISPIHHPVKFLSYVKSSLRTFILSSSDFDPMSPPPEFAVVICHGPYLSSASYSPLIDALESKKIEAYCPQLATNDSSRHNLGNLDTPDYDREPPQKGYPQVDEDVEIILTVLRDLIKDQGKRVLLICHSTGSFSGLEAAQQELQEKVRMVDGLPGGIFGILHIGGFLVTVGHSINSAYQRGKMEWPPKLPPFFQYHVSLFSIKRWTITRTYVFRLD